MDLPLSLLDRMVSIMASAREEDEQSASADFVLVLELLPMLSIDGVMGGFGLLIVDGGAKSGALEL